jgi:hypothetical protein
VKVDCKESDCDVAAHVSKSDLGACLKHLGFLAAFERKAGCMVALEKLSCTVPVTCDKV